VLIAWAATLELRLSDGLVAFDKAALRALAVAIATAALLWALGRLAEPLGAPILAGILFAIFWPLLWATLRFGLPVSDRAALRLA
jgi:hypothetical protein